MNRVVGKGGALEVTKEREHRLHRRGKLASVAHSAE